MNKIGIIGIGKLGLCYALCFEEAGFDVCGSSNNKKYIKNLQDKTFSTVEPNVNEMLQKSVNIRFTSDNHEVINHCDTVYLMVATPSTAEGNYDLRAIKAVVQDYLNYPGDLTDKILIVGSTVNPGDCDEIQSILQSKGVKVVYSPTLVAQGEVIRLIRNPDTIYVGTDDNVAGDLCEKLFSQLTTNKVIVNRLKRKSAEIVKLAGNAKSTLLISFYNAIGQLLVKEGLEDDLENALHQINLDKFGVMWKFGYGYGGPCYPRDNESLLHYAKKIDVDYPFGRPTIKFNQDHSDYITNLLLSKNKNNLPFYFEYISYKKNVAFTIESQPLLVCKNLLNLGKTVYIEKSNYLPEEEVSNLSNQFKNQILIESISDIKEEVYNATNLL